MSQFSDTLMEHFEYPLNRRPMKSPTLVGRGSLNGYPPFMTFFLRTNGGRVIESSFEAAGCGVTIACGSVLTEIVVGRDLADCARITAADVCLALDGIPSWKQYCADVTVAALQDALRNLA